MAYRRKPWRTWYFDGKTRTGYQQVRAGTRDERLARRLEAMWRTLAEAWAWDVLEQVPATLSLAELYTQWETARHHLPTLRQALQPAPEDPDLFTLVDEWAMIYTSTHKADQAQKAVANVRWLLTGPRPASQATAAWLESRLAAYPGRQNTRRRVHSSWSVFFDWCTRRGLFPRTPMDDVKRPAPFLPPPRFYELAEVQAIVEKQPDAQRRAFLALIYGTGADVSPALALCRRDLDEAGREVRIAGTKAVGRDRIARVAPWAWPIVMAHAKTCLPAARLFPWDRWTPSDWHRETVGSLCEAGVLSQVLPLRNARHHWAVRAVRGGMPLRLVADQLGNSETMVSRHYARFIPQRSERDYWEGKVEEAAEARSSCSSSCSTPQGPQDPDPLRLLKPRHPNNLHDSWGGTRTRGPGIMSGDSPLGNE